MLKVLETVLIETVLGLEISRPRTKPNPRPRLLCCL